MALPGVVVSTATTTPPRSAPTDTGVAFLAGLFEKGPAGALLTEDDAISSLAEFQAVYGTRQSYSVSYDWVETYFREGGNKLYASRVLGPAAALASLNLAGTGTTLVVTANSKGAWANGSTGGLSVEVVNGPSGSSTRVLIVYLNGVEVERSTEQTTRDLIASEFDSDYVTVTVGGGSGLPTVAAAANLTSGADDRGSITQTHVTAALAQFPKSLGPGQVVSPDWQTSSAHLALGAHASDRNRFAVCDPTDTTSKATLLTAAAALSGGANASRMALIAPWITVPASAAGGSARSVPPSALLCGRAAVTDASDGPNQAPAGEWGRARFVDDVKATFSRDTVSGVNDAEDLNDAGVNLIIDLLGVRIYGNRTLVDPDGSELNLLQLSNARYRMSLVARGEALGQPYVHGRITKQTIDNFGSDLIGLMLADYTRGDLFGDLDDDRPETAFNVDTTTVNTAESIAAGTLAAAIAYRPAPGAEIVEITLTATSVTEPVA